jgi:CheY-like chemotaxis protein
LPFVGVGPRQVRIMSSPLPSPIPPQAETILVVEDQVLIRLEVADYLRECGYRVLEAADASEAIAVMQTDRRIDLVFSDVQMPGPMDGFGLSQWVRTNQPVIKVILTSGVARSAELASDLCEHGPIEAKPYHPQRLADRIKTALDQVRRAGNEPSTALGGSCRGVS